MTSEAWPRQEGISLKTWVGARNPFHLIVEVGWHHPAGASATAIASHPGTPFSSSESLNSSGIGGFAPKLLLSTLK